MKWKSKCCPRHPGRDGAPGLQGPGRRRGFPGHHAASVPHRATSEDTQQHPAPTLSPQHLRRPPEAAAGAAGGGDRSQDTGPRQAGLDTGQFEGSRTACQHATRAPNVGSSSSHARSSRTTPALHPSPERAPGHRPSKPQAAGGNTGRHSTCISYRK